MLSFPVPHGDVQKDVEIESKRRAVKTCMCNFPGGWPQSRIHGDSEAVSDMGKENALFSENQDWNCGDESC